MKKVCKSLLSLSDEGVHAPEACSPAHTKKRCPERYGGQTGIRLRVTTPRMVQRNKRKRRPGIPGKGAWHGRFNVSLIPQIFTSSATKMASL